MGHNGDVDDDPITTSDAQRAQVIIDSVSDVIVCIQHGLVTFASPSIEAALGYAPSAVLGRDPFDILHPDDHDAGRAFVATCFGGGAPRAEFRVVHADGHFGTWSVVGHVIAATSVGSASELVLVGRDITELLAQVRARAESEQRLDALLDLGSDLVIRTARDGTYLDARTAPNSSLAPFLDMIMGHRRSEFTLPESAGSPDDRVAAVLDTGEPFVVEIEAEVDGESRVYLSRTTRFDDDSVVAAVRDITDQRQAEIAAVENQARFRRIVENAHEGVWWIDPDGVTTFVNRRLADMFGYEPDAMIGMSMLDFLDDAGRLEFVRLQERRRRGFADVHRAHFRAPNGRSLWAAVSAAPDFGPSGEFRGTVEMINDVTQERRTALSLERSEARFRALVEQSLDWFAILDTDGTVRFASSDAMFTPLDGDRSPVGGLVRRCHPDDRATVDAAVLELLQSRPGTTCTYTHRMIANDGTCRVFETVGRNLFDVAGIAGVALHARDITARVEAEEEARSAALLVQRVEAQRERERLELELERSQRFEAVGRLAAGVAHDFNNLLGVVGNYLRVLAKQRALAPDDDVARIEAALLRAADLTRELLAYGDAAAAPPERLCLDVTVRQVAAIAADTLDPRIEFRVEYAAPDVHVRVPRIGLDRCVLNLVANAADATVDGGVIVLATSTLSASAAARHGLEEQQYAMLTVSDTGVGIPASEIRRVREPFVTTKASVGGTGLGLAIVQSTITDAGGFVHIDSQPGRGTAVTLLLPVVD